MLWIVNDSAHGAENIGVRDNGHEQKDYRKKKRHSQALACASESPLFDLSVRGRSGLRARGFERSAAKA